MKRRRLRGRAVNGILLLNKPLGMTSNEVLQEVKFLYFAQKAGHTGSLDPLATGMLPICFGEATKLSQYLLDADKHYQVTGKLGVKTTTADAEGSIVLEREVKVTRDDLEACLLQFRGEIQQIPSMYSALKYQGRPLYELARESIEIERQARVIHIRHLEILAMTADTITLDVKCSKGTYIRNLIEDIGEVLGCGAHVIALHRLSSGYYDTEKMLSLEYLKTLKAENKFTEMDHLLLSMDSIVEYLPSVQLPPVSAFQLKQGNTVQIFNTIASSGLVRLYENENSFIGVGEIVEKGKLIPHRLIR